MGVSINGLNASSCTIGMETDTAGKFQVGLTGRGGADWTVYFDNIVASVQR